MRQRTQKRTEYRILLSEGNCKGSPEKKGRDRMNKDAWYQYFTECEAITDRNAELMEEKFKECEAYTEKVLKKKYPECGVVFTRHAEAIKAGYFTIWIDTGSVTHKNIKLEDCGIKPVELYDYPIRPDYF